MDKLLKSMWPEFENDRGATIKNIAVNKDKNELFLSLFCSAFDSHLDDDVSVFLRQKYPNMTVCTECSFPKEELCEQGCHYMIKKLIERGIALNGFFDGASISVSGERVQFELAHGGLGIISSVGFEREFCAIASEVFGASVSVEFAGVTEQREQITDAEFELAAATTKSKQAPTECAGVKPKRKGAKMLPKSDQHINGLELESAEYVQIIGKKPTLSQLCPLSDAAFRAGRSTVFGEVFSVETRETKGNFTILKIGITDKKSSIELKLFDRGEQTRDAMLLCKGDAIVASGDVAPDRFDNELVMTPRDIIKVFPSCRHDDAKDKRVELHLHTNMSAMDAIPSAREVVTRAAEFGHRAVAITDHGVVQSYPEAHDAMLEVRKQNPDFKILYGIECYYVDDTASIVRGAGDEPLSGEMIFFDLETTGLNASLDRITEIGAVRICDSARVDSFSTLVNPGMTIPPENTKITGITDEMVKDAPCEREAVENFLKYIGDRPLIAHNASFDIGFLRSATQRLGLDFAPLWVDTLPLARALEPDLGRHRLDSLAKHFSIKQPVHHRALDDAETLAAIWERFANMLIERGVRSLSQINSALGSRGVEHARPYHMTILVKNMTGLRNLYELVTESHLTHYANKRPRMTLSDIMRLREGLIIGSACEAGEVYTALVDGRPWDEITEKARKYDYFEIQPLCNNAFLERKGLVRDTHAIEELNRSVIRLADELARPVVATCDVHFLDKEDGIFRQIIISGMGYDDADEQPALFFRTTDEMLAEFAYLGEDTARRVVIENTNLIADMIDPDICPIPSDTYTPVIEGAEQLLTDLSKEGLCRMYGDNPNEAVVARMERELNSIIGNGYSVLYVIAHKLVARSEQAGYHVGSRGSVGSSFIGSLIGITEVNPLPPHYICPKCKYFEFRDDVGSGFDLPDRECPQCGAKLRGDGQDIPFETFLGFRGEKQPDIDLNFSGEFQQEAHRYTEELFGKEHVFKAGTISALQDKKAFGFVRKYSEEKGLVVNRAEENRLILGCTGVKQTTGQHPGGMVVIPAQYSINDFTPAQHPADKKESDIITTHFDFNSLHDTLLKLDELGHDVPTIFHYLEKLTGVMWDEIPMNDPQVIKLFTSTEPLGVNEKDIDSKTGTFGLPEMGTSTVRGILVDSEPTTFAELVQVSGLSHGTNVWAGNAQSLIADGTCRLKDVIGTRDSIMLELMRKGVDPAMSFEIMEFTRKGRAAQKFTDEQISTLKKCGVPDWFIESCKKIKYMFPKAHAVGYVTSAIRLAWFKLYYPLEFYSTYFTVRGADIDTETAVKGLKAAKAKLAEQKAQLRNESARRAKMEDAYTVTQIMCEMLCRGFEFLPVDFARSNATQYLIEDGKLRLPFVALKGVGENAARALYAAAQKGSYISAEEIMREPGVTQSLIDALDDAGALGSLPRTSQMSLWG